MTKAEAEKIINDPDNHYPYARDRAEEAGIPAELVKVSEAVVNAQEAYLRDPSDKNLKARNDAERKAQEVSQKRRARAEARDENPQPATIEGKSS
jgi:hypothetical protein